MNFSENRDKIETINDNSSLRLTLSKVKSKEEIEWSINLVENQM